jgi:hypothetical protein
MNILHRKYQNFIAAASIYDYLSTGRTASLVRAGNDPGAYNIYEDDVRVGRIIKTVGMVGSQIISAVKSMEQSLRCHNQAICDAIENASSVQHSYLSQINEGIATENQADIARNQHLKEIADFQRIQTNALRERNSLSQPMRVKDKSGYYVDE